MQQNPPTKRLIEELEKLKKSGITYAQMATDTGYLPQTLNKLNKGQQNAPIELIEKFIVIYKLNRDFIFNGTTKALTTIEKSIPYYNIDASAGNVSIFKEAKPEYITGYIKGTDFDGIDMFIGVVGDSMYPKYQSGDQIGIRRIKDFDVIAFGEAHVIVTEEQVLLKYLRKGADKHHWSLFSEKEGYDPIEIGITKVLFLFIVKNKITKKVMG